MRSATTAQDSTVSLAISTSKMAQSLATGAMGAENLHRAHQFASAQCLVDGIPTE
tara:strand:- start:1736 stop:1900 length:165 start_codon:yes stop_codon:yes gene_type:complete